MDLKVLIAQARLIHLKQQQDLKAGKHCSGFSKLP